MRSDPTSPGLELKRVLGGSPEEAFAAWTQAGQLQRWFAPTSEADVLVHEMDARAGGRYRLEIRFPDGSGHVATGEYREVERPSRLSFTWRWEGTPMPETLVTIDFIAKEDGTELTLSHTGFVSDEQRDQHVEGWTGCLAQLEASLRDSR